MTNEEYLLGKLAEEASEIVKEAIKAQQFGLSKVFGGQDEPLSNREKLNNEFNDLLGVIRLLNLECSCAFEHDEQKIEARIEKIDYWQKQHNKEHNENTTSRINS